MSELANYSIETDHTVLLAFKDGRKLRVPTGQLAHYLSKPDFEKVTAAIKLRRDFIQRHMPKIALLVAGIGLVGLLTVGGRAVAQLIRPPQPVTPAPEHTEVVRNQIYPTPSVATPAPSPAVQGAATTASAATPLPTPARKHRGVAPKPKLLPAPVQQTATNLILPLPSVLPNPIVNNAQPSPTPLPTPPVPNQNGDVLGDSTSPSPSPLPDPGPLANLTPNIP
jgi:hypothetical protein